MCPEKITFMGCMHTLLIIHLKTDKQCIILRSQWLFQWLRTSLASGTSPNNLARGKCPANIWWLVLPQNSDTNAVTITFLYAFLSSGTTPFFSTFKGFLELNLYFVKRDRIFLTRRSGEFAGMEREQLDCCYRMNCKVTFAGYPTRFNKLLHHNRM